MISIIIPTYNRYDLIGQTLDSIINQIFKNWECIVVDDRSDDYTDEVMDFYQEKDQRIRYFKRPQESKKGGNSCRNFGLIKSKGEYIQWFDSDDLMMPEALKIKMDALIDGDFDFVVAKMINFSFEKQEIPQKYNRANHHIKFEDYLFRRINWMTPDPLIKKEVLRKYNLRFNENMFSDQEYNLYCRLLLYTENGKYIDRVLTRRRIHKNSIQSKVYRDTPAYYKDLFRNRYLTFLDLETDMNENVRQEYLNQLMTIYYLAVGKKSIPKIEETLFLVRTYKGNKALLAFLIALGINFTCGKGYYFLQLAKNK